MKNKLPSKTKQTTIQIQQEASNLCNDYDNVTIRKKAIVESQSQNKNISLENEAQMRNETLVLPNPNEIFPVPNIDNVIYIKPTIQNPNIIVGDFTYFSEGTFENHVSHHYDFYGDKLIIGKFCQIAAGVQFIMNGANHQMNAASTFPFYIFKGWNQKVPPLDKMPLKGNTVIGNDVWIGQNAIIMPGVHIGDGAIIGLNSVVASDIPPYTIAAGNPAKVIRKRFDEELTQLLLNFQWWNLSIEEINDLIPILTSDNLKKVKDYLKANNKKN